MTQLVPNWPGMGPRRLTNRAIALCEEALIDGGIALDCIWEAAKRLEAQHRALGELRTMRAEDNVTMTVQEHRRHIARRINR